MNHYHSKVIKIYYVSIFLAVLFSFHALFPHEIYAQQDNQNAAAITESVLNDDKQSESTDVKINEPLASEELIPASESPAISEIKDEAKQLGGIEATNDEVLPTNENMKPAGSEAHTATKFKSISLDKSVTGLVVRVESDGIIKDYKSFTLKQNSSAKLPARIVFDIFNMKSPFRKEQSIPVNTKWVSRIRHYMYPEKFRVVLDTKNEYLNAFSAKPVLSGLLINIGSPEIKKEDIYSKSDIKEQPAAQAVSAIKTEKPDSLSEVNPVSVVSKKKHENNLRSAWVDKIDFLSEEGGKSTITIGTTKPVKYSINKASDKLLQIRLNNTNISVKQKRPLITTRFNSAVDGIWPVQTPEMKKSSIIAIELREAVPYVSEQSDNLIKVHFEPSSVSPKPEKEADIPVWKEALEVAPIETVKKEIKKPVTGIIPADVVNEDAEIGKKYTGEKVALDFYDTDIKNVFRILKEVSGKNFAIDKNVSGKVTLSLEKPVPWDQALDLVLKMNQLGMVYEGDIVRIANLETIKKEKELRQAGILADKKALEQQKELEPLVVEYIPVSYSNAKTEILPHLEKIKTKDRGSISIDERTNLVIITDVPEVIKQAKEIVKKLDKVTPQVVIEARIVEATTSFSREIGVIWSADAGPNSSSSLGGTYDLNAAVNFPTTAANKGTIGFDFARINGSPFLLNAKLEAMEAQGEGKIVSAPKICTLDNKEATIKQGLRYPYNKLDTSGNTTTVFEDVDLELKVKPHVTPDNRISMLIKIKKRDLGNVINSQQSFTNKEAETELLVNDGDTVVIGGIIKTSKNTGGSLIPGLSRIPILGWFFKSDTKTDNKEELLIFITPKIVTLEQKI